MSRTMHYSDTHLDIPLSQGIVLVRTEQGVATNVPHYTCVHSPDGFEFGYGGSGPADLALNIAEAVLRQIGYSGNLSEPNYDGNRCFEAAMRMHQNVKWQFVAPALHGNEPGSLVYPFSVVAGFVRSELERQRDEDQRMARFIGDADDFIVIGDSQ